MLTNTRRFAVLVLLGTCAAAGTAPAQTTAIAPAGPVREGFWIGVGLGVGNAGVECAQCSSNQRYGAPTFTLRMGGTPTRHVLVGGELNGWGRETLGVTETLGDLSAVIVWYPSERSTFYVKGGLGVVVYQLDTSPKVETEGMGINAGVGIDIYLSRNFSLTPYASVVASGGGPVKIGGTDTGYEARPNLVLVGIAATWH